MTDKNSGSHCFACGASSTDVCNGNGCAFLESGAGSPEDVAAAIEDAERIDYNRRAYGTIDRPAFVDYAVAYMSKAHLLEGVKGVHTSGTAWTVKKGEAVPSNLTPVFGFRYVWDLHDKVKSLQTEVEDLQERVKELEDGETASNAVISYILQDGDQDGALEFLRFWNEGSFDTLRKHWPRAPQEIYLIDPHRPEVSDE